MFKFDSRFFEKHQERLLYIANNRYLRWILGINRLSKEIRDSKIDKITPNSIHTLVKRRISKKGLIRDKFEGKFFLNPRFAESLAFCLSPFCYIQEASSSNFSWRFSPAGIIGLTVCALSPKLIGGMAFFGTTANYNVGTGVGWIDNYGGTTTPWADVHALTAGATGRCKVNSPTEYLQVWTDLTAGGAYYLGRAWAPVDTSGLSNNAVITSASMYFKMQNFGNNGNAGDTAYAYFSLVGPTTQADFTTLVLADFDQCGAVNAPTVYSGKIDPTGWSSTVYSAITLNAAGIAGISKTGYTGIGLRTGWDIEDVAPGTEADTNGYLLYLYPQATSGKEPYLGITYTFHSRAAEATLPASDTELATLFTDADYTKVATEDNQYVSQGIIYHKNTNSISLDSTVPQYGKILAANQTGLNSNFTSAGLTIEAWVKYNSFAKDDYIVTRGAYEANTFSYAFNYSNSTTKLWVSASSNGSTVVDKFFTIELQTGVWYHLAAAYNVPAGTAVIYVDGVSLGTLTGLPTSLYTGDATFYVGGSNSNDYVLDGLMNEVRFWNEIRTVDEINQYMRQQLVGNETDLIGYWRFNGDATDLTVNNNDLTLVGSPSYSAVVPFSDPIIDYYNINNDDYQQFAYANNTDYGQIFTALETYKITSIRTLMCEVGTPADMTVGIYSLSGGYPDALLTSGATIHAGDISTSYEWYEVALTPYTLTAGVQYAIVFTSDCADYSNEYRWACDSSSPTYTGGAWIYKRSGSWGTSDIDFMFETVGEYGIGEFLWKNTSDSVNKSINPTWIGKSMLAPSTEPVLLQIYNRTIALKDYFNTGNDNEASVGYEASYFAAETFTPAVDYLITSVKVKLYKTGSPTGNVSVSITTTSSGEPVEGTILTSSTIACSGITTNSAGDWYEATFATPYRLTASTKYSIMLDLPSGDHSNRLFWLQKYKAGSPYEYSGGNLCTSSNSGGTWTQEYGVLMFEAYGNLGWETLDTESAAAANTKFTLTGSKTDNLTNYYDANNMVSCRTYQSKI